MSELLKKVSVPFHACVKLAGSVTVYTDPFGLKECPHDADLILVTHSHHDHLSPEDIAKVKKPGAVLVLPTSEKGKGEGLGFAADEVKYLAAGETLEILGVTVEGVAAYNKLKPFHPKKNGWLGYVIGLDGVRYYVAGDTDATPEARSVRCDVALVPVGGHFTMDAKDAAKLVNAMAPKAAVPIHYGSGVIGSMEDAEKFRALLDAGIQSEILLKM